MRKVLEKWIEHLANLKSSTMRIASPEDSSQEAIEKFNESINNFIDFVEGYKAIIREFPLSNEVINSFNRLAEVKNTASQDLDGFKVTVQSFVDVLDRAIEESKTGGVKENPSVKEVFLIHGHDNEVKSKVARFIEKELDIDVKILHEIPNRGRHIFEKFEDESNVSFAIALLTPDDETNEGAKRARQNVIFEMGYFLGKLGRGRVILLKKGEVEIPSDLHGVIYIDYDGQWQNDLRKELI